MKTEMKTAGDAEDAVMAGKADSHFVRNDSECADIHRNTILTPKIPEFMSSRFNSCFPVFLLKTGSHHEMHLFQPSLKCQLNIL